MWGLCFRLEELGHEIFVDQPLKVGLKIESGIEAGERWYARLDSELKRVDCVLSIWSGTAQKKLASKRGAMFAKEVAYGAVNNKLQVALINTKLPPFAKKRRDQEFLFENTAPNFDPLERMIEDDEKYGFRAGEVSSYLRNGQFVRIEGLRPKKKAMATDQGLLLLHRERLRKFDAQNPGQAVDDGPNLDPVGLESAVSCIDREEQADTLDYLISRPETGAIPCATIHASPKCEAKLLLQRFDRLPRTVRWRASAGTSKDWRKTKFLNDVEDVIGDLRERAAKFAEPEPFVLYSRLTLSGNQPGERDRAAIAMMEWQAAIRDVPALPQGLNVLFCMLLIDQDFLHHLQGIDQEAEGHCLALGPIESGEMLQWCKQAPLGSFLRSQGIGSILDEQDVPLPAESWIANRIEQTLINRPAPPNMEEAMYLARAAVAAAHARVFLNSTAGEAVPPHSINQTAFGESPHHDHDE